MKKELLENINQSPVITWSWLKVNNITIKDYIMPQSKTYSHEFLPESYNDNLVIENIRDNKNSLLLFPRDNYKGISEELLKQCEFDSNAGAIVQTPRGYKDERKLFIDFQLDGDQNYLVDNNLIIAGEESELNIFIKYSSTGNEQSYHNGFTRIYGKRNSKVKLVKLQDFNNNTLHLDSNFIQLEEGATVTLINIDSGSKQSIVNWNTLLCGDNSQAELKGVYIGDENKQIDINYIMKHVGKGTTSSIYSKGALMQNSTKTFKGTIDFRKGAKGSKGREEEYTMLLSKGAKARAVPLILCDEEDIEGSHAASAGKIDEDKLFYIMSRGFSEFEAKKLIIEAEINPILECIEDEETLKEIKEKLGRRLLNG